MLDLGLVAELDDVMHRSIFARYFAAWANGDGQTMADIMVSQPDVTVANYEGFRTAIQEFVNRLHGKRQMKSEVASVV